MNDPKVSDKEIELLLDVKEVDGPVDPGAENICIGCE